MSQLRPRRVVARFTHDVNFEKDRISRGHRAMQARWEGRHRWLTSDQNGT
jgi:hypothetical protein